MRNLAITARGLLRAPALSLAIVLTVGLGIGASTGIFAVVNAALLQPLPYPEPDALVRIYTDSPPYRFPFSVADYLALHAQQTRFASVAAYADQAVTYSDGRSADRLRGRSVTSTYFPLLGFRPSAGRLFAPSDDVPGAADTVVLTHRFWQQRLGGRADAIGTSIKLDAQDYTVIGVLPPLAGPLERTPDVFLAAQLNTPRRKGPFFLTVLGRLSDPSGRAAAADELRAINRRIFPIWRSSYQDEKATWGMMDLREYVAGDFRRMALLAFAATGLVWLIACVNASNLLLARVTSRRRELAVRSALGATRTRIVGELLRESGVLAALAAFLGFGIAAACTAVVRAFGADYVPRINEIALTGRVQIVFAIVTFASLLLFGLIPALHGAGGSVDEGLRAEGRGATGSRGIRRLRSVLVSSQFAVATPLLIVAGLLLSTLQRLERVQLGFDTRQILTGSIVLPASQYHGSGPVASFWATLRDRVTALPGVSGVAFTDSRPPDDSNDHNNFDLERSPTPPGQSQPVTPWVRVSADYFGLLGMTLREGRLFNDGDTGDGPEVVIVDEAWEKRFFPHASAVGQRLKSGGCSSCPWTTVVGVVSNMRFDGLDRPDEGTVYTPMPDRGDAVAMSHSRYLVLRISGDASAVLPSVGQTIHHLDPGVPFSRVATIDDLVSRSLERPRALSLLVGALAVVALVLSVIGIYGVMAHYVQQHTRDIGIRLALGGPPSRLMRSILVRGMSIVALGTAAGLGGALGLARLASSLLFGVTARDPATFTAVPLLLVVAALVGCGVPALRAIAVDPAVVLRSE
jgi:putative ABC transport system permease protein